MIKGILLTIIVLLILHYYGINVDKIITQIGTEILSAWQWVLQHTIKSA